MASAVSLNDLLSPQVILRVISRIRPRQNRLSRWLGFQPERYVEETTSLTGPNVKVGATRFATFRIFDKTRAVPVAATPGTGPVSVAPNPVGSQNVECARFHMKIELLMELLGNLSPVVGPNSNIDPAGQDYVKRQTIHLGTRFNNGVELLASGMLQDSIYFVQQGARYWPQLSAPLAGQFGFQVPMLIPAGNKGQVNALGTGNIISQTWSNPAAPILQMILTLQAAFNLLSGYTVEHGWVNSILFYNIITNNDIRAVAGTANTPYAEYENVPEKNIEGGPTGEQVFRLKAIPMMQWHIDNDVLALGTDIDPSYGTGSGTLTKMVPDGVCFFTPEPSDEWVQMYNGGEMVVENPGMPAVMRQGYYFWKEWTTQPSGIDLIGLCNMVPMLFIPKAVVPAQVIF